MIEDKFIDYVIALIILVLSASEIYKGVLMVFRNQNPILFTAKLGFLVLRLFPEPKREERYQKALRVYTRRRKIYGIFALLGGMWGILLAYLIVLNS